MKKIILGLLAILALSVSSCKESVDIVDPGQQTDIAGKLYGTYTGTWSIVEGTNDPVETDGIVTVGAPQYDEFYGTPQTYYNVFLDVVSTSANAAYALNVSGVAANVTPTYALFNGTQTNALETPFTGSFDPNAGTMTLTFSKAVKDGRATKMFYFTFTGGK